MYDELIKRLRDCTAEQNGEKTLWCQAADAIEELTDTNVGKWIPVTERLPIRGDRVLCFGDNGINTVDFVCGDKWWVLPWFYLDGEQETGVTHWMPLPQPPKEE